MASASVTLSAQPAANGDGVPVRRCKVTIPSSAKLSKDLFQAELVLNQFSLSYSKEESEGKGQTILLEDLVGYNGASWTA